MQTVVQPITTTWRRCPPSDTVRSSDSVQLTGCDTVSFHAANRAKNIKNKPKINEDPKDAMLREYQDEIKRLRDQLEATQRGMVIDENGRVFQLPFLSE